MPEITLFVGPSGFGIDASVWALPGLTLRPPARRDDVEELIAARATPGVIVLCDGVFESHPAVSHREIGLALDLGWQVWGVSSIGAIRAREMRQDGMRGYGEVFNMFCQPGDFCDDEVCLLHFPEAPYFPVSEPLVNVRYALRHAATQSGPAAHLAISAAAGAQLIDYLRGMWFGDRSNETMRDFMQTNLQLDPAAIDAFFAFMAENRIKNLDLQHLLQARPWETV
jgi:hypothetical protein